MSFKEKVDNYLEEQRKIEEAKEKTKEEELSRQKAEKEDLLKKEMAEYQKKAAPLIEALNRTPIQQWLEEIKKEKIAEYQKKIVPLFEDLSKTPGLEGIVEKALERASPKISLFPNNNMEDVPSNLYAEIRLTETHTATGYALHTNPDNIDLEKDEYSYNFEESIVIGCEYNNERKIQFYSAHYPYSYGESEKKGKNTFCLNDDPKLNQKIEKALIVELIRLEQKNK